MRCSWYFPKIGIVHSLVACFWFIRHCCLHLQFENILRWSSHCWFINPIDYWLYTYITNLGPDCLIHQKKLHVSPNQPKSMWLATINMPPNLFHTVCIYSWPNYVGHHKFEAFLQTTMAPIATRAGRSRTSILERLRVTRAALRCHRLLSRAHPCPSPSER